MDLASLLERSRSAVHKLTLRGRPISCYPRLGIRSKDIRSVWIVQQGENASVDYIVAPAIAKRFNLEPVRFDLLAPPPVDQLSAGVIIVLVRYVNPAWMDFVQKAHQQLAGVIYFMDDDLLDFAVSSALPTEYRKKVSRLATSRRDWIVKNCAQFWVSSGALAEKYAALGAMLVEWSPPKRVLAQHTALTISYHGTSSHMREQAWLYKIVQRVLSSFDYVHFEIFGNHAMNKLYRELPRVSVLHPMGWTNYLAFASANRRDIGLAPLLEGGFNEARGPTKYFDFARLGAAGIFSNTDPYIRWISHGKDGVLVDNHEDAWVEAISRLVLDETFRRSLAEACREKALNLSS